MAPKKIMVEEKIQDITYQLEGELEVVITRLEEYKYTFGGKYTKLWIEKGYGTYDDGHELELWGEREETDKEYEKRIKKLAKEKITRKAVKEKAAEEQYATYLYLKEKYEGGGDD